MGGKLGESRAWGEKLTREYTGKGRGEAEGPKEACLNSTWEGLESNHRRGEKGSQKRRRRKKREKEQAG